MREGLEWCDRRGVVAFNGVARTYRLSGRRSCFAPLRKGPERSGATEKPDLNISFPLAEERNVQGTPKLKL